jgi:hypothetical protein
MNVEELITLLARKPEMITEFPARLLPPERIEELSGETRLAIAEIAGRDSIAAALVASETLELDSLLPTIAYTGTDYGDWSIPVQKAKDLAGKLESRGIRAYPPLLLGAPRFWWLLCGRPAADHFARFHTATFCLGCHLYFHAIRIPLARKIGATMIVGGEREDHDGRTKLNQTTVALDAYTDFVRSFGLDLQLPIRNVGTGDEIRRILGEDWKEGEQQVQCTLSGNYLDAEGNLTYDEEDVRRYFEEYAIPVATKAVQTYLKTNE